MSLQDIFYQEFYNSYHGHPVILLERLLVSYRRGNKEIIFLAGDSSFDNKYWILKENTESVSFYKEFIKSMVPDVAYQLTNLGNPCINCAVEEATIGSKIILNEHDEFIRDNIENTDTLIISIGGNDIAFKPSHKTIFSMIKLLTLNSTESILKKPAKCWGIKHLISLFKTGIEDYINKLIANTLPKKIMVCGIYFPDENNVSSWANTTLFLTGYNCNPDKLQYAIKAIYNLAISRIEIGNIPIITVPLYNVLNGKKSSDYVERVEPSVLGSEKIAKLIKLNL